MQTLWKSMWRFLKKLGLEALIDPVVPLLGIYLARRINNIPPQQCMGTHVYSRMANEKI